MQPLPFPGVETVLDCSPSKTSLKRLRTAEHTSLPGDEAPEFLAGLSFFVW
jgi:hypothetical protein